MPAGVEAAAVGHGCMERCMFYRIGSANTAGIDGGAGLGGVAFMLALAVAAVGVFVAPVQLGNYSRGEGGHAAEDRGEDGHDGSEIGFREGDIGEAGAFVAGEEEGTECGWLD